MKIGLLFSGQGAQCVGMAKSLYDSCASVRELFERADSALGYKISEFCFCGPMSELTKTSVCQPALYLHGIAVVTVMRERGMLEGLPSAALGLSLGELTAHAVAETYDFETGLKIVAERGRLMQAACDASKGAMASLIGGDRDKVFEICARNGIDVSNLNCPGQTVISGEAEKVERAVAEAKALGIFKMIVPLKVAGAYHSRLMEPARAAFEEYLGEIQFKAPQTAVFTNVTGKLVSDPAEVKSNLVKQVVSTVRWEDCVRSAIDAGVESFYECGPGGVLAGMMRRIDKTHPVKSLAEIADFA